MSQNLDYKLYILFSPAGSPKTITTSRDVLALDQEDGDFVVELRGEVPKALVEQMLRTRIKAFQKRSSSLKARKRRRTLSGAAIETYVENYQKLINKYSELLKAGNYDLEDLLYVYENLDDQNS